MSQGSPYEAFVLSLGLYVLSDLVHDDIKDPASPIVSLVQESFCKALHKKIKHKLSKEVKRMKYQLKFKKVVNTMLESISSD